MGDPLNDTVKGVQSGESAGRERSSADIRHELRTPLNQIIGYSEMMREEAEEAGRPDFVSDLGKIEKAGHRLLELIDDIVPGDRPSGPSTADTVSSVPLPPSGHISAAGPAVTTVGARSPARLLVVDDDPMNRDMLCRRLEKRGYGVSAASGGAEALHLLSEDEFDLVLLDVMMPEVTGLDVLRSVRLRRSRSELPIIMATAKGSSEDIVEALANGANDYVTKPLDFPVVQARVDSQLNLKRALEETRNLNRELTEAQERIAELVSTASSAVTDVASWSAAMADQVADAVGASAIGVWVQEDDRISSISGSSAPAPSPEQIDAAIRANGELSRGDSLLMPVTGLAGEVLGALHITGGRITASSRHLIDAFKRHLGSALELRRMRKELAEAENRNRMTREDLLKRGIPLLQVCPVCRRCYDQDSERCEVDGSGLESPRPFPYEVATRYRLRRIVGDGGMGTVYRADDMRLNREVALKIMKLDHYSNEEMRLRFEQEALTIARIDHPCVVSVFDSGKLDDGSPFLVMEWLDGMDLDQVLKKDGPGTPRQVARLLRFGASALGAAHRSGLVHRDIKPANIFLVDHPAGFKVKLLDFGIAKEANCDGGMTQTGAVVGTPRYMSPEQVSSRPVGYRSDIYSFAAVVYEALTGHRVTDKEDYVQILVDIAMGTPTPVSGVLKGASREVDEGLLKGLSKNVDDRPQEVEEWADCLSEHIERIPESVSGWKEPFAREG